MFGTAMPGAGYGYGAQQVGPQSYYGGFHPQPGSTTGPSIGMPFGQPQAGGQSQLAGPTGVPGFGYGTQQPGFGYGAQQPGFGYGAQQPGFGYGGQQPGFGYGAQQPGIGYGGQQPGFGSGAQQNVLPLTFGAGTAPFIGHPSQLGGGQLGSSQFGQVQPQIYVVPVPTPQGWIWQLVVAGGQPPGGQPPGGMGQAVSGQQFGAGLGGGSQLPWIGTGQPYGYGGPQLGQPMMTPSMQAGGIPGGLAGGYLPLQQLQQIPQGFMPMGGAPFPGQPLTPSPIH